jgi:hypothetical protein
MIAIECNKNCNNSIPKDGVAVVAMVRIHMWHGLGYSPKTLDAHPASYAHVPRVYMYSVPRYTVRGRVIYERMRPSIYAPYSVTRS